LFEEVSKGEEKKNPERKEKKGRTEEPDTGLDQ